MDGATARVLAVGMVLASGTKNLSAEMRAPREACAAREAIPKQLHPSDCGMATIVMKGIARSASFRLLVERVGALNGIVYIHSSFYVSPQTKRLLSGALSHRIDTAGAYRVLHLIVAPASGDEPLVTIAHELQHVIEVLEEPSVQTEAAVDRLFERIGMHVSAGVMETQAALEVERVVRREVLAKRE